MDEQRGGNRKERGKPREPGVRADPAGKVSQRLPQGFAPRLRPDQANRLVSNCPVFRKRQR